VAIEDVNEEEVFRNAIQLENRDEQANYVKRACGNNIELCAAVEALLQHHHASSILDAPALESGLLHETTPMTEGPGTKIGRYKLLEKIGEGGMASVYMAEQKEPIRRKVALKIIKLGMDTKQVITRFEAERQALAMMDHPNIARVFDAGATETGRPFFVMELVTGISIAKYCDKSKLSTQERLDLFIQVCSAVQHAHQKGIIHRDIKPSNVMVTLHDGKPVPKVIDFGIAKATNRELTEKTMFTRYAHMIGTPAYMSPEQAEMSGLDIDTRADIYSLGVLLYELLTGTTPFDADELREAGYIEMQRIICEEEPSKPSTKLSTMGETLTGVAAHRQANPETLTRLIKGDLDWIVMKTLEKDRTRRYESVHELALDIQRHLNHEPVAAGSPGVGYRLKKYVRRHKSKVIAAFLACVLLGAMAIVAAMYLRAQRIASRTASLGHAGVLSKAREAFSRRDFDSAKEQLASILDSTHVGREAKLLDAKIVMNTESAAAAMPRLNDLLKGTDRVAGEAHFLMAQTYYEGDPNNAAEISELQQKWDYHRQKAEELLSGTATYDFLQGAAANAVPRKLRFLSQALEKDGQHFDSLRERVYLYYAAEDYVKMLSDASRMIGIRPENPLGYSLRATALREIGSFDEALEDYRQTIRLSPGEAEPYDQRRQTFMYMSNYEQALADAKKCVSIEPDNLRYHFDVFCAQVALGRYDSAIATHRAIVQHPKANRQFNPDSLGGGEAYYHINMRLQRYAAKYLFDTLAAGRTWHPPGAAPEDPAFRALTEAAEYYQYLKKRARRLVKTGYVGRWSPDGSKLAYSTGVPGFSGLAILDLDTGERKLLAVPGRDPLWSPDGRTFAYVRNRKIMTSAMLADPTRQPESFDIDEICLIGADGIEEPRPLVQGFNHQWSKNPEYLYYQINSDFMTKRISVEDERARPEFVAITPAFFPAISPDGRYVAEVAGELRITDIATRQVVQKWRGPLWSHFVVWSPDGQQLAVCGRGGKPTGLWIYDRRTNEGRKLIKGPVGTLSGWSPDGSRFEIC
jgi:tetratricopeptide (TPR) repeat protein